MKKEILLLLWMGNVMAITKLQLESLFKTHPFSYDLGIRILQGKKTESDPLICCHGYGYNNQIVYDVTAAGSIQEHALGFNFPDYNCLSRPGFTINKSVFGSIEEIMPLLFIMRECVIKGGCERINLYGFSAGGGAVINALAVLNQPTYDTELSKLGINVEHKKRIIDAIEKGIIMLDCPLKSMDEIVAFHKDADLSLLASRYAKNNMVPLHALEKLRGLSLHIFLHFQKPDDILSNRDDGLFIERLQKVNTGKTIVTIGNDGGHNAYNSALWNEYRKIQR